MQFRAGNKEINFVGIVLAHELPKKADGTGKTIRFNVALQVLK